MCRWEQDNIRIIMWLRKIWYVCMCGHMYESGKDGNISIMHLRNAYMCLCVCVCVCAYTHVCVFGDVWVCGSACACLPICAYACTHAYTVKKRQSYHASCTNVHNILYFAALKKQRSCKPRIPETSYQRAATTQGCLNEAKKSAHEGNPSGPDTHLDMHDVPNIYIHIFALEAKKLHLRYGWRCEARQKHAFGSILHDINTLERSNIADTYMRLELGSWTAWQSKHPEPASARRRKHPRCGMTENMRRMNTAARIQETTPCIHSRSDASRGIKIDGKWKNKRV